MRIISETEFKAALSAKLIGNACEAVTGPGRSGAVAAVYASYLLHIPFVPYGQPFPGKLLVVDTVSQSGKTLRRAEKRALALSPEVVVLAVFSQASRLHFWFEFSSLP